MSKTFASLEKLEDRLCFSGETGLRGDYYNSANEVFSNSSVAVQTTPSQTETDPTIDFAWGSGAPATEIRWSGQVIAPQSGSYVFHVTTGAGVRLWVNGQEIINNWNSQLSAQDNAGTAITLTAGASYDIRLDVNENGAGSQGVEVDWSLPDGTRQVIPNSQLYPFSKPISIISGGLYVGSWESTNQSVPAVGDHTTQPVTVEDSTVRASGNLIQDTIPNTQLSVINNTGYGLNPNIAGALKGDFLYEQNASNLDVEHNTIIAVGGYGIDVYGFTGTGSQTIKVLYNSIQNSDGRYSDGNGGYEDSGIMTHSIAFQNIYGVAGIQIGWNQIVNAPGVSYVNDVVNLFEVSGTQASPVDVHDNYIRGLYALNIAGVWDSGSGITTDGSNDPSVESAFIDIDNNQIVSTGSAGIGDPAGHDIQIYNNRLISTGYIKGGIPVFASGTGVYIDDLDGGDSSDFYNNAAYDNVSGWIDPPDSQQNGGDASQQRDYELPSADTALTTNNADWPGPINGAAKAAEFALWQTKLQQNGLTVGAGPIGVSVPGLLKLVPAGNDAAPGQSPSAPLVFPDSNQLLDSIDASLLAA